MAKRGKLVRKLPSARKTPARRKRAPADVELKKENAGLRLELAEALERQTATSEVLQVISSTPGDLQLVFQCLLENATRVCGAKFGTINLLEGEIIRLVALHNVPPEYAGALGESRTFRPHLKSALGQLIKTKQVVHIADLRTSPAYLEGSPASIALSDLAGARTLVIVPMLRDAKLVGTIGVYRQEVRPFTDKQIELLSNFAKQAVIAIENARLLKELHQRTDDLSESLEQQTATSEVLKVISSSPGELDPVFQAMLANATRICEANFGMMYRYDDGAFHPAALLNVPAALAKYVQDRGSFLPPPGTPLDRLFRTREVTYTADETAESNPGVPARLGGARSLVGVPMLKENELVGAIIIYRQEVRPFTDRQVELVRSFASQAVIAIENTRLLKELRASLQQQTATADVLKVISRSTFDLQTVLQTLVESAARLCDADKATITRQKDGVFFRAESYGLSNEFMNFIRTVPVVPDRGSAGGRTLLEGIVVHIPDVQADPEYAFAEAQRLGDFRTILSVPMLRQGVPIGLIALMRSEVLPFTDKQIELVTTFADQAVIAIENARLFDEVQAKTRDLTEALTYQTGSANILSVIASSPTDVRPVLKAIVESACELCDAYDSVVLLRDGDQLHISAHHGPIPLSIDKWPINRRWTAGRAFIDQKPVHVHDLLAEGDEFPDGRELSQRMGHRTIISVPLLREGESIGAIVLRRTEVHPFGDKQIALLQSFADQAVIAIGNVRLFDEVQARTEDLRESLQQQIATADVLKVISRSTFDLQTVLQTLVESAARLCEADNGTITRQDQGVFYRAEAFGFSREFLDVVRRIPVEPSRGSVAGRALLEGKLVHIPDVLDDPEYTFTSEIGLDQFRTALGIPMLREGVPIGVLTLSRSEARPFTDKQIELVTTFADQAAIAIENVRLFDEVQAKTRDLSEALTYQTGSANILRVIASSPTDVKPVLNAIVESACELCGAYDALVRLRDGEGLAFGAHHGPLPVSFESVPISANSTAGLAVIGKKPVHVHDLRSPEGDQFPHAQALAREHGERTILSVPLLRENESIGAIILRRLEVNPFSDKQIALLQTFADQAVIAIGNVRLFEQVQERTKELSESLDDLRTAQDRLIQTEKLASLGQLTAGIAHEIKNPLNFVNNFSALSVELVEELNDVLKPATLDNKTRVEADELTHMLKGNLEKVVQHGKRADLIVKNMLLHSREGSTERRLVNLNGLVEECLNLAYHGARAENQEFKINLERSFDPTIGRVDLFPQEMTRVLLNLISNGFYAATKRKAETKLNGYEPTLAAATENLGDRVEIRIRDNGGGIPAEVMDKIFNPFFTTKPPGEGTGLGLSLSHDIVVKQHAGSIEVDTRPGEFTEFKVILPRMAATGKAGANK